MENDKTSQSNSTYQLCRADAFLMINPSLILILCVNSLLAPVKIHHGFVKDNERN